MAVKKKAAKKPAKPELAVSTTVFASAIATLKDSKASIVAKTADDGTCDKHIVVTIGKVSHTFHLGIGTLYDFCIGLGEI